MFPPPPVRRRASSSTGPINEDIAGLGAGKDARGCSSPSTTAYNGSSRSSEAQSDSERPPSQPVSWRTACVEHREKSIADRALVKEVADWGPQVGHVVDLYTGKHTQVTFWLRDDVKALCIYDCEDGYVGVYVCSQMEHCEEVENAEAASTRFFLNLAADDMRRGILITMDLQVHAIQIVHQGQMRIRRAQILLLVSDKAKRKALLGALLALHTELLLHERRDSSDRDAPFVSMDRGLSLFAGDDDDIRGDDRWPPESVPMPPTPAAPGQAVPPLKGFSTSPQSCGDSHASPASKDRRASSKGSCASRAGSKASSKSTGSKPADASSGIPWHTRMRSKLQAEPAARSSTPSPVGTPAKRPSPPRSLRRMC